MTDIVKKEKKNGTNKSIIIISLKCNNLKKFTRYKNKVCFYSKFPELPLERNVSITNTNCL